MENLNLNVKLDGVWLIIDGTNTWVDKNHPHWENWKSVIKMLLE